MKCKEPHSRFEIELPNPLLMARSASIPREDICNQLNPNDYQRTSDTDIGMDAQRTLENNEGNPYWWKPRMSILKPSILKRV